MDKYNIVDNDKQEKVAEADTGITDAATSFDRSKHEINKRTESESPRETSGWV